MFGWIKKLFEKPAPVIEVQTVAAEVAVEPKIEIKQDIAKIEEITAQIYEATVPAPKRKTPAKKRQEKKKEVAKKTATRKKKAAESDE